MSEPRVTVVIPTLHAGPALLECLRSLREQSFRDFEVFVVDNSGAGLISKLKVGSLVTHVIENQKNVGFGVAINQVFYKSRAPYLAVLNDDAVAHPQWLESLLKPLENYPNVGMCASQVRLAESLLLDSAGMLLCPDGTSKQRGHGLPPSRFPAVEEVLLPSGSAAIYRRRMLEEIGLFDDKFFLYCEDTDLGLRARWAGWKCLYVPEAIVNHRYSESAGRASKLKAYLVERNRIFMVIKNFPIRMLLAVPFYAVARFWWHFIFMLQGKGKAAEFREEGNSVFTLVAYVIRAHLAAIVRLPALLKDRRRIRKQAKISSTAFKELVQTFSISPREVASL